MADSQNITENISKICERLSKTLGAQFFLKDRPLTFGEVFSDKGLLPALCKRADQLCSLCLGYGIGVTFEDEAKSMLGTRVIFDQVTPLTIRIICIMDVLCELYYTASSKTKTPLDELLYD